ncbi:MAG: DNA polymerase I [Lachnospiraceae bacterium]|nr:DNA polymerase I [Lachnospiraceae bacterium]
MAVDNTFNKKLVLLDGHSILSRAFYGVPNLTNAQGLHTNAVYGFLNIMFKILEEEKPDYLAVAFDVHAPTFRHRMYEAYKGTRKPMPDELKEQVPVMKELLCAMNIAVMEEAGLEADDILGTLARNAERDGIEVSIVSGDRDLLQIATSHIKIRIPKTKMGRTEIEDYYEDEVKKAYQVTPAQFIELKALMGDASDNIPGVPKIGEKTAISLMAEYGSIDNIYAHLEEIPKKSIRETLRENRALADLSLALATIRTDCGLTLDYAKAGAGDFYTKEAYSIFKWLEFKNYLSRFSGCGDTDTGTELSYNMAEDLEEFSEFMDRACKAGACGLITVTENEKLLGVSVSFEESGMTESCFYSVGDGDSDRIKNIIFELSCRAEISTFDIKPQYRYLSTDTTDRYFDILIAAYLLNPLKNDYDIETIASEHMGIMIKGRNEIFGKRKASEVIKLEPDRSAEYFCNGSYVALKAKNILSDRLVQTGMDRLMYEMEMPLSLVLFDMEKVGIEVRRDELKAYGDALTDRICELEDSIHRHDFNINSPKQLGEVLFEAMKLPGGRKTKTGYSTAADVLEKLSEDYPIVKDILEYRGLTKLKSTYADGLAAFIGEDERIHTNFNQTITATGRISSTEPNLQNIPMRMELGRRIRKVFVPGRDCVLMDADYSQIELRVLAHMSGDEQLIEAYRSEQDIHRITASQVFHVPFDEVTGLQRRNAKAVNFGIVYGISSFGLSQDLSISKKEAAEYIEQYFATYPGVKHFLDSLVSDAKEKGYAETMFGRRRPIPELSSSNFMQRSFGERVAMNSPIQGTAADIIKLAMIKVWRALKSQKLKSKLILQIHDELVIETYKDEEEEVRRILEENMKSAAELEVTLAVDLHTGENWYEAK